MFSELPDLDEDISFVVDDGASTGPVALRSIVDSIRSGERPSSVLVWWAGATDWMRFDMHDGLLELLEPVAEAPTDAQEPDAETAEHVVAETHEPAGGEFARVASEVQEPFAVDDEPIEVSGEAVVEAPAEANVVVEAAPDVVDEPAAGEFAENVIEAADEPAAIDLLDEDPVAIDERAVEAAIQREGSTRWGAHAPAVENVDPADEVVSLESESESEPEPELEPELGEPEVGADAGMDVSSIDPHVAPAALPVRDKPHEDDEATQENPALTGLFSAPAREDAGLTAEPAIAPSPDALDAILAARLSLESVGARIEALTTATRRSQSPEVAQHNPADPETDAIDDVDTGDSSDELEDDGGLGELANARPAPQHAAPEPDDHGIGDVGDLPHEAEPVLVASVSEADSVAAEEHAVVEEHIVPSGSWQAVDETDVAEQTSVVGAEADDVVVAARVALTERFEEMVRKSVSHQRRIEWIMRVDELLLSACITAIADSGFVAIDLTSRESDHRVLFDHNDDSRKVRLELAPVDSVTDHIGRHVRFGLSWGRDVENREVAFETVRAEASDEAAAPGELTCGADPSTSSVSTHVELILAADDFVKDDYSVDRSSLDAAIAATLHALEQRWHQLFVAH